MGIVTLLWGGLWFIIGGVLVGWLFLKQPAWAAKASTWLLKKIGLG